MYNSIFQYNNLDNNKVTRTELLELVELAKNENQTFIVQKISDLLRENPDDKCFKITLQNKIPIYEIEHGEIVNEELNAPKKRFESQAKQNCRRLVRPEGVKVNGQLKKGYKYLKGGKIVKIAKEKKAVTKVKTPKVTTKKRLKKPLKLKQNLKKR